EHLSLHVELAADQRGAAPERVRLSLRERIVTRDADGVDGLGCGGDLRNVGGCRSLARHAGPFPCVEGSPQVHSPTRAPAPAGQSPTNLATPTELPERRGARHRTGARDAWRRSEQTHR